VAVTERRAEDGRRFGHTLGDGPGSDHLGRKAQWRV
jgi:hypothetical protein